MLALLESQLLETIPQAINGGRIQATLVDGAHAIDTGLLRPNAERRGKPGWRGGAKAKLKSTSRKSKTLHAAPGCSSSTTTNLPKPRNIALGYVVVMARRDGNY